MILAITVSLILFLAIACRYIARSLANQEIIRRRLKLPVEYPHRRNA